jgi:DNA-directed RNA polymerase subunit E"
MKACKSCYHITELDVCPLCGGELSKEWQGYLIVMDWEHSVIAQKMSIKSNGRFALKVR